MAAVDFRECPLCLNSGGDGFECPDCWLIGCSECNGCAYDEEKIKHEYGCPVTWIECFSCGGHGVPGEDIHHTRGCPESDECCNCQDLGSNDEDGCPECGRVAENYTYYPDNSDLPIKVPHVDLTGPFMDDTPPPSPPRYEDVPQTLPPSYECLSPPYSE